MPSKRVRSMKIKSFVPVSTPLMPSMVKTFLGAGHPAMSPHKYIGPRGSPLNPLPPMPDDSTRMKKWEQKKPMKIPNDYEDASGKGEPLNPRMPYQDESYRTIRERIGRGN